MQALEPAIGSFINTEVSGVFTIEEKVHVNFTGMLGIGVSEIDKSILIGLEG